MEAYFHHGIKKGNYDFSSQNSSFLGQIYEQLAPAETVFGIKIVLSGLTKYAQGRITVEKAWTQ